MERMDASKEAKGLTGDFVATLGLFDIILGGIALYALWLCNGKSLANLFPSTNREFLDIALLTVCAALLGKIVLLVVAVWMAVVNVLLKMSNFLGYYSTTKKKIIAHSQLTGRGSVEDDFNWFEFGLHLIAFDAPTQRAVLDRIRTQVITAYSAMFLLAPFAIHAWRVNAPAIVCWYLTIGPFLMGFLGVIQHLDYIQSVGMVVKALRSEKDSHLAITRDS